MEAGFAPFGLVVAIEAAQLLGLAAYSSRNARWLVSRGAVVLDASGIGRMNVLLRTTWLLGSCLEVWIRAVPLNWQLFSAAGAATVLATALRIASMRALGRRWTLPTVVLPRTPPVEHGIYRLMKHPNWTGVLIEIVSVPLMGGAYVTAAVFLGLEALLLASRVRAESQALQGTMQLPDTAAAPAATARPLVAIIGAGAAGLAAARACKRAGLDFEVLEARSEAGGLWLADAGSAVSKNTHVVSPKSSQAYTDAAMPDEWPDYPHHRLALAYLQGYAAKHGLSDHIRFDCRVLQAQEREDGWQIRCSDGSVRSYTDLVVASGCHDTPKLPAYPGRFDGSMLHSRDYRGPEQLQGRRVLVVGAGQSAVDILCDAVTVGARVLHSTRRGFLCVPRYVLGVPLEFLQDHPPPVIGPLLSRLPLPATFRMLGLISAAAVRVSGKRLRDLQLPRYVVGKDPALPTLDQRVYNYYAQGDIRHKGAIRSLQGTEVQFEDGSVEAVDTIVCATGFQATFDFLDPALLRTRPGTTELALDLEVFHPSNRRLCFIGLVHPIGAHWPVFEAQARLVAAYIAARRSGAHRRLDLLCRRAGHGADGSEAAATAQAPRLTVPVLQKANYLRSLRRAARWLPEPAPPAPAAVNAPAQGAMLEYPS